MSSLPALQSMLERMESMAGRIVANELMAVAETDGYGAQDEIGRDKLRRICQEFHQTCAKVNRDNEIANLHWRVQRIAKGHRFDILDDTATSSPVTDPATTETQTPTTEAPTTSAQLRVPTSRKACSWWIPDFWSIARPTDFCYGDCVWGFMHSQPVPLKIHEWITMLWRREEAQYDVEPDENYKAAPINRFRTSWYDLHVLSQYQG